MKAPISSRGVAVLMAAGLRLGDRVVSVEGPAVEDLPLYSRWPAQPRPVEKPGLA